MIRLDAFRQVSTVEPLTLETILTDRRYFGLTTASPLQRAICRVLDGIPIGELAEAPEVGLAFGGVLPTERPKELVLLAGIRCGKSLMAGACAVRAALTCDVSSLSVGDVPRASILSFSLDTARATWTHVRAHVEASPLLRSMLVGEPTADTLMLRHQSGRPIEIRVVAGSRAAGSLVARWSAGIVFDEAPRMIGSEDGVVNIDEQRQASIGRLLPGCQTLMVGSPWAPFGPVFDLYEEHFGKPSAAIAVVRAPNYAMNPCWWTEARCAELKAQNPDAYNTDVLCNFMDPLQGLFTLAELQAATRSGPEDLPPNDRFSYVAAMDPATRGNGWALVVTTNLGNVDGRHRYTVVFARQWVGSKTAPLSARAVFTEIAALLRPYRVTSVLTDQWGYDVLREIAGDCGLGLVEVQLTRALKFELFERVKGRIVDGTLELAPNPVLVRDLSSVRKIVTRETLAIELPDGSDGRHADYAIALALALSRTVMLPDPEPPTADEAARIEQKEARERAKREVRLRLAANWAAGYGRWQ